MPEPKDPKDKKGQRPAGGREDFDKTIVDLDVRNFDKLKEDFKEGFEETVMVRLPQGEELDHAETEDFFDEDERTGDHDLDEIASGAKPEGKKSKSKSAPPPPEKKPPVPEAKAKKPEEKTRPEPKPAPKEAPKPAAPAPRYDGRNEGSYTIMGALPVERPKLSLVYLLPSALLLLLTADGMVEVLSRGSGVRIAAVIAALAGLLVFAGILLRRIEGRVGFLWLTFLWFGLVAYSGFKYFSSDPEALTFLKFPLSAWLGGIVTFVGFVLTWNLWQRKRYPFLSKILSALAFLILLTGLAMALIQKEPLEGSFWGPGFLSAVPLFLRPGVLTLSAAFPIYVIAVLLAWLLVKPSTTGKFRRFAIPLLLIALAGTALGAKLLARQGIGLPFVGSYFEEPGMGMTVVDPFGSSVQVKVETGKVQAARDNERYWEVAASRSLAKGKDRESRLMVKNLEGRSLGGNLQKNLSLTRGDKPVRGVKVELAAERLGSPKSIFILPQLASLTEIGVRGMVGGGILRIASLLGANDRIYVGGAGPMQTLTRANAEEWSGSLAKALIGGPVDLSQAIPAAFKKLSGDTGLKQVVVVVDAQALPPPETRAAWVDLAKKAKTDLSFIVLGALPAVDEDIYLSPDITGLGFEMLAASAQSLGQYSLQFPSLPPLPRILLVRDANGQVNVTGGKIPFSIQASDPAIIQLLQVKVDDEKPVDLDRQGATVVDLDRLKVKPGPHRLTLLLTTTSGDIVSETFTAVHVTRKPLKFAKPMEKDSLSGTVNVLLSPGRIQGLETGSIDLLVDGAKVGAVTAEPYLIPLDTKSLSEGEHQMQAVQTFPDGSTESVQLQVTVNQQVPQLKVVRPSIGEYLSNLAEIEAQIGGGLFEQVQKVEFFVDGEWIGESLQAPYRFLWPNNAFPAGKYFVQARALLNSQAASSDAVEVQLGQGEVVVQADPMVSTSGMLFPENVEVLLDASASMNEPLGPAVKLDLAKFALGELLQSLPQNVRLLARAFGSESYATQGNCTDSFLLKKPASELEGLTARGRAPLAYALKMLSQDLKKAQGSRVALLITDGWDGCGEDPLAVASQLAKQSDKVRLHIIYFGDVDAANESLLKKLAEVMGGQVFKVKDQAGIIQALKSAIQVSFSLYDYKNTAVVSQPLNREPLVVRSGEYRLEIDTSPPIVQEKVVIPTGSRKTFTVLSQDGKFQLKEE